MCLAVPGQLLKREETEAEVDLNGNRLRVNIMLVPEVKTGDWVLVHAGFAIQVIDAREAAETWSIIRDAQQLIEESQQTTPPSIEDGSTAKEV